MVSAFKMLERVGDNQRVDCRVKFQFRPFFHDRRNFLLPWDRL